LYDLLGVTLTLTKLVEFTFMQACFLCFRKLSETALVVW